MALLPRMTPTTVGSPLRYTWNLSSDETYIDMTDFLGYGKEKRRAGNLEILAGHVTFRYVSRGMYSAP
jgi:hypothetical protein